jgi:regulator of RNase E activity RraA
MFYKQCKLQKKELIEIAYIPEIYAHEGDWLQIGDDNGWLVVEVYQNSRCPEDQVMEQSQEHKHQRKASDI